MNNFIIISRTYSEWTYESDEEDIPTTDNGFIVEEEKVTFRELVKLMQTHNIPSNCPITTNTWCSCNEYTSDYKRGTKRIESIHFHRNNTKNAAKYWRRAITFANYKNNIR